MSCAGRCAECHRDCVADEFSEEVQRLRVELLASRAELCELKILLGRALPYVADYVGAKDVELADAIDRVLAAPDSPLAAPGTIANEPGAS
jgi:hypothetical protein